MIGGERTKEDNGKVFDASRDNWVDRAAPNWTKPYLRLSRADRPIGTWLLLLPCWWGLFLGILYDQQFLLHDVWIFFGCAIGAFLMRGAGCTWNDIADRDIDQFVQRTKSRPIPSGQVKVLQATVWMVVQMILASLILFSLNGTAITVGLASILPVLIYPFAKRFTWWPQVFLGIAFNWGILLAFSAHSNTFAWPAVLMYFGAISWTLFYDTIYAHQDRDDDALIGVKSTARLFGNKTVAWLRVFIMISVTFMILSLTMFTDGIALIVSLLGIIAFAFHLIWQVINFRVDDKNNLPSLFKSNRDAGLILTAFLFLATAI